jgi:hypothetical protein
MRSRPALAGIGGIAFSVLTIVALGVANPVGCVNSISPELATSDREPDSRFVLS